MKISQINAGSDSESSKSPKSSKKKTQKIQNQEIDASKI